MKKFFVLTATLLFLMVGFSSNGIAQSITVSGAGSTDVNGIYSKHGSLYNGKPMYTKDPFRIAWSSDYGRWWIEDYTAGTAYYHNFTNTANPPDGGWVVSNIYLPSPPPLSPAPTLAGDVTPFPVELVSFTASTKNNIIELKWNTATEVNNYGFEIERSRSQKSEIRNQNETDGWAKVGFVEGAGTTNSPKSYSFTDANVTGKVSYRLKQIDRDGKYEYSNVVNATVAETKQFALEQNYPNPFNPATTISYQLPVNSVVTLKVYDAVGREVASLVNEAKDAGTYSVQFDGSELSSGVYFYTLRAGTFSATRKLILMK